MSYPSYYPPSEFIPSLPSLPDTTAQNFAQFVQSIEQKVMPSTTVVQGTGETAAQSASTAWEPDGLYTLMLTFPDSAPASLDQSLADAAGQVMSQYTSLWQTSMSGNTLRIMFAAPGQRVSGGGIPALSDLLRDILEALGLIWQVLLRIAIGAIGIVLIFHGAIGTAAKTGSNILGIASGTTGAVAGLAQGQSPQWGGLIVVAVGLAAAFVIIREVF